MRLCIAAELEPYIEQRIRHNYKYFVVEQHLKAKKKHTERKKNRKERRNSMM